MGVASSPPMTVWLSWVFRGGWSGEGERGMGGGTLGVTGALQGNWC